MSLKSFESEIGLLKIINMKKILLLLILLATKPFLAQDSLVHDASFGNAGYANVSLTPANTTPSWHPSNQNEYYIAALQRTDGKIALVSHFNKYGSDSITLVVRLINPNGTTDATFNGGLGYQSMLLNCLLSDNAAAIIANDNAILFMPGQRVYRLDPVNNYAVDVSFAGGNGYFQFASGFGNGISHMNYFPQENLLTLSGKMGSQYVAEASVINATTGDYVGQVATQDWDFNPFNGDVNSTDCLVNDTLMYQLGSARINPSNDNYLFYVHLHSLSNLFDTLIPLPQVPGSFANQKIHGAFLEDQSLLVSFFTFAYNGLPDQIRTIHLFADGSFDTNYGKQVIDSVTGDTWDAFFTKDYSNEIYLYTHLSNVRRVYKFNKTTGYLDQTFCGDGIANLISTSGFQQSNVFALNDQSLLVINKAPYQGGVNPINANSLMKYVDYNTASVSETAKNTFEIYPNPASTKITLSIDRADAIIIRDLNGKIVQKVDNFDGGDIKLVALDAGVYFMDVVNNNQQFTQKMILE